MPNLKRKEKGDRDGYREEKIKFIMRNRNDCQEENKRNYTRIKYTQGYEETGNGREKGKCSTCG